MPAEDLADLPVPIKLTSHAFTSHRSNWLTDVPASVRRPVRTISPTAEARRWCARALFFGGGHQLDDLLPVSRGGESPAGLVLIDVPERGGRGPAVENLYRISIDQAGMLDATGLGHLDQVASERLDVVGEPNGFQLGVETVRQPGVLGGDAGRTGIGVTFLGLDAADRQHGLAGDVHQVTAEREGDDRVVGQSKFPSAAEDDLLLQIPLRELGVDPAEPELEGQRDGVGEDQRRRTGSSLATVDGDEVDASARFGHQGGELIPELQVTDRSLDPDRQAGLGRQQLDPIEQAVGVGELRMTRRTDAVPTLAGYRA